MTQQTDPTLGECIKWVSGYKTKAIRHARLAEATIAHLQRMKAIDERAALWAKKNTFRPNGGFDDDGAYD